MAYVKQEWANDEVITKDKLDHIEEGIANIELTPGEKGETGIRGSRIWSSNNVTGTSANGTVFANSGITEALVYDYCLNKDTGNLYVCSKSGNASVAEWKYDSNIKGAKGDKGDAGAQGLKGETGAKGEKGDTGANGKDAVINKLDKIDNLDSGAEVSAVVTSFNSLLAGLKAKGFMNE